MIIKTPLLAAALLSMMSASVAATNYEVRIPSGTPPAPSAVPTTCDNEELTAQILQNNVPGTYRFTAPTIMNDVKLTLVGAGGGGRTANGDAGASSGGSGAVIWRRSITVSSGETFSYQVGQQGFGNGFNAVLGLGYATSGDPSSFDTHVAGGGFANLTGGSGQGASLPSGDNAYAGNDAPPVVIYNFPRRGIPGYNGIHSAAVGLNSGDGNLFSLLVSAGYGGSGSRNAGGDGQAGFVALEWTGCSVGN